MAVNAIRFTEFLEHPCAVCGELMHTHWIRPLHVPELPGARAIEVGCPMLLLDLAEGSQAEPYANERG